MGLHDFPPVASPSFFSFSFGSSSPLRAWALSAFGEHEDAFEDVPCRKKQCRDQFHKYKAIETSVFLLSSFGKGAGMEEGSGMGEEGEEREKEQGEGEEEEKQLQH